MIRRLGVSDMEAFTALRREALADSPRAFSASPEADVGQDPEHLRRMIGRPARQVLLGAFETDRMVGTTAVRRFEGSKELRKAVPWGMYVRPGARGRGHGAALLAAALRHARSLVGVSHLHLSGADTAVTARRPYEHAGSLIWGAELAALVVDGSTVDVHHMVRLLEFDLH